MKQRLTMFLKIEPQKLAQRFTTRKISQDDYTILGKLMLEAYKGTIDYDGETLEESIEEMKGTLEGKYGAVIDSASFAIEENNTCAAAVIFTLNEKEKMPLLTFAMTHPDFKNKGLSKHLINKCLKTLFDLGFRDCFLIVTEGNEPAQTMYEKMGFKTVKGN